MLVLGSGRGEGDPNRPAAALTSYDLASDLAKPTSTARVEFPGAGDDPGRLAVAGDGRLAAVSVIGPKPAIVWLDLTDPSKMKVVARRAWPDAARPDAVRFALDGSLLLTDDGKNLIWHQSSANSEPISRHVEGGSGDIVSFRLAGHPEYWAYTLPFDSGLAFLPANARPDRPHDRLPLLGGRLKLSSTRPVGLAVAPGRGLIAVANQSGGSVHLIAVKLRAPL